MAVINTNTSSLNAQRNLGASASGLATSLQRLSSGLRINSAKDDAAGLAISSRMTSQINGLNQAARNANDGISLAQTAESALSAVGDNLQRIRDLSVQSSNATNNATDRAAIQKEVGQLKTEIDRVANQTAFNGTKVLNGSFNGASFQVGANSGETITVASVTDARTASMGSTKFATSVPTAPVTATSNTSGMTINGVAIDDVAASTSTSATADKDQVNKLAAAINAKYDQTGVYASIDSSNNMTLSSTKADTDIDITGTAPTGVASATAASATASNLSNVDVSDFVGSQRALVIADSALNTVNSGRADLGAVQNRFASTISNLQSSSENLSASRSRIQDTDFAAETANLTRGQILQQAGTAMLAQANSLPNGVLSLLRG